MATDSLANATVRFRPVVIECKEEPSIRATCASGARDAVAFCRRLDFLPSDLAFDASFAHGKGATGG